MTLGLIEAVLTSTHNLCFEQKYEKYQRFLSDFFFQFFGGEIFFIFAHFAGLNLYTRDNDEA